MHQKLYKRPWNMRNRRDMGGGRREVPDAGGCRSQSGPSLHKNCFGTDTAAAAAHTAETFGKSTDKEFELLDW